jgi:hypothetical protein
MSSQAWQSDHNATQIGNKVGLFKLRGRIALQ